MTLLKMSGAGALMILAVTVIRVLAVNRLPKKAFLVLWAVVLARLLIPFSLPCALSVYSLAPAAETPVVPVGTVVPAAGMTVMTGTAVPAASSGTRFVDGWTLAWLAGAAVYAAFFGAAYLKCRRKFRESVPLENREAEDWLNLHPLRRVIALRQSGRISAPLTYGVLRPVILMPKSTDWRDTESLRFVLAHEYVHIRRFDAVTKLALTAALCVHWFNPAVWLMYVLANRDIELSCDETVVRLFGTRAKPAYAMALLRMEEARSGLTPLCSHFSRNAMEERIIAIMKMKKTTWAALLAAAVLVVGVTTAFATSARRQDRETIDRAMDAAAAYEEQTMMSIVNAEDGMTYYSEDDGQTWTALTDAEFKARYAVPDVEWWTAEEYSDWLENEKVELQNMIGERGWTPSTGWFTWDQQRVDEAIVMYEGILESIRNGVLVSKSVNGSEETMLAMGTQETGSTTWTVWDEQIQTTPPEPTREELLALYGAFGISFGENGDMLYNGQTVHVFVDGVDVGDGGYATHYVYRSDKGEVDLCTVRSRVENGDGSYDPFGPLTGIVVCDINLGAILSAQSQPAVAETAGTAAQESDWLAILSTVIQPQATYAETNADAMESEAGRAFPELLKEYEPFGISYVQSGPFVNLYYHGELVNAFIDRTPDGGYMTVGSIEEGGTINVQTVYDANGKLIDVKPVES